MHNGVTPINQSTSSIGFYKPDVCSYREGDLLRVTVKFYSYLRNLVGPKATVELDLKEGTTISLLLNELFLDSKIKDVLLDENHTVKSDITIMKNGREIKFLAGMDTELNHGDEISIFPLVAGG